MEEFLKSVHKAKACFEQKELNNLMQSDRKDLQHLCFDERKEVVSILMSDKLLTTNLIKERQSILIDRANKQGNSRRQFLDGLSKSA